MIKAEVKTEITITNEEIVEYLLKDGSIIDTINDTLIDMLFIEHGMSFEAGGNAIDGLTMLDYAKIFETLATELKKNSANASS